MVSPSCSARSSSSFVVLSSERKSSIPVDAAPGRRIQVGITSLQGRRHEHLGSNTVFPKQYPGGSLDMRCSRRESCSRVFTPAFTFKAPGLFVRRCFLCPFVHPEVLVAPDLSRIPSLSVLSMVQSFRRAGMGVLHVGVDVGAEDAEVDVIYISFIVSVQYKGYLWTTEEQLDTNRTTVYSASYDNVDREVVSPSPWE